MSRILNARRLLAAALVTAAFIGLMASSSRGVISAAALGDPAQPLTIGDWIKGGPVDLVQGKGKNFYVVEFWATFCPPCRKSIPHLTELQKKYKDQGLIVVGISGEDAETVKPFVAEFGDKMDYAVALDRGVQTSHAYLDPFDPEWLIPYAFVVDKQGRMVWHGSPLDPTMVTVIDKLAKGTFSLEALVKEQQEAREMKEHMHRYFTLASSGENNSQADQEGAWLLDKGARDPGALSALAEIILTSDELKYRDKGLAMRAAQKAYELTQGKDPRANHIYALAFFDAGKIDQAIKYQKEAVAVNTIDEITDILTETLKKYESQAAAPAKKP